MVAEPPHRLPRVQAARRLRQGCHRSGSSHTRAHTHPAIGSFRCAKWGADMGRVLQGGGGGSAQGGRAPPAAAHGSGPRHCHLLSRRGARGLERVVGFRGGG
eukprot:2890796-Rhodomonas_salina.1